ncbi:MAG: hypothetical protein KU29_13690 [Sulfurovum sp. FS06-10]|nr:MAG: hypothetical protein KU29_13690 [Sulfurovum sp. FS06-10]
MLLYLVYDTVLKTLSTPLIAPSLEIAQSSLKELNPENLSDLQLHPLTKLNNPLDLFLLTLDTNIPLPDFLTNASKSSLEHSTSEAR